MTNQPATPALQPSPDVEGQAVCYLAHLASDEALREAIGPARKVLGVEGIAFAFSHSQPNVRPVLVVLATHEPHLPGLTFHRA